MKSKLLKKLGITLCLSGLALHLPPVMRWLTLYLGDTIGRFGGIVCFALGWSILGAMLAFSAGIKYQHVRVQKQIHRR